MPQSSPPPQQYPILFLLSMAAVSLWGWLLFSLSPHAPQLGGWFWAGNPILLYVHPPLATACGPVSTVESPGPPRTGVGQATPPASELHADMEGSSMEGFWGIALCC